MKKSISFLTTYLFIFLIKYNELHFKVKNIEGAKKSEAKIGAKPASKIVKPIFTKKESKKPEEQTSFFNLDEDFIPYASHFNAETIVTKNIQLLQTIKVNSFLNQELHHDVKHITLREALRSAIKDNIKSDDFAFWIHTIRRKADLHEVLQDETESLAFLNKKWNDFNHFEAQFINELYVTILIKGVEISAKDVAFKYFTESKLKSFVDKDLQKKCDILQQVTDGIIKDLANYSAKKLQIVERKGVLFSENIEFFHKILNLNDISAELDQADISSSLAISQMSLSLNKINFKNEFGTNFVSVLTLKHYLETKPQILDKILSLPFEFIIYQAFDFININQVSDKYENQYKMLQISKDRTMLNQLGLSEAEFGAEQTEEEKKVQYGENQISIIVIGETEEKLESETKQIAIVLENTGFVSVREDVMIEDTFFGSLPGNFFFLRRMQPIQTKKVAGFASIDNYPIGKIHGNTWGEAVALFKSKDGLPFFFNFHDESGGGHTLFFGKYLDIQKNAIANFLEFQSLKFKPRIINIDIDGNTKIFTELLSGKHVRLSGDKALNTCKLNPFVLLNGGEKEMKIFEDFMHSALQITGDKNDANKKYLSEKIIPFVKTKSKTLNQISDLTAAIKNEKIIKTFFKEIIKEGSLGHIFDSKEDAIFHSSANIFSIDIGDIFENETMLQFLFNYLIESILSLTKDKAKTILKIDNFFEICSICKISKKRIISILKELKANNVVLLMLESYSFFQNLESSSEDAQIMDLISTQIYNPAFVDYETQEAEIANNYLAKISKFAQLTLHEKDVISSVAFDESLFTIKHSDKIIPLSFNPNFDTNLYYILANREIDDDYMLEMKAAKTFTEKMAQAENIFNQLLS